MLLFWRFFYKKKIAEKIPPENENAYKLSYNEIDTTESGGERQTKRRGRRKI